MKTKWMVLAVAGAMSAVLATCVAIAQRESGWMQMRASGLMMRGVERDLGITDEQRTQIKSILKTEEPAIEALAVRVHEEQMQLQAQPGFDEGYVRAFAKQHESTMEDVLVERVKVRNEIRDVLTSEQREKADQMRSAFYSRFTDRLAKLGDQI